MGVQIEKFSEGKLLRINYKYSNPTGTYRDFYNKSHCNANRAKSRISEIKTICGDALTGVSVGLAIAACVLNLGSKSSVVAFDHKSYDQANVLTEAGMDTNHISDDIDEMIDSTSVVQPSEDLSIENEVDVSLLKNDARAVGTYYVKKGETLWSIAKKFNSSLDEFMARSNLSSDQVNYGQIIVDVPSRKAEEDINLSDFANEIGMNVEELAKLNNLSPEYIVRKGERVFVEMDKAEKMQEQPPMSIDTSKLDSSLNANSATAAESSNITLKDSRVFTSDELYETAISSAPDGLERPYPIVNSQGQIQAEEEFFEPTNIEGDLVGKTVLLNAGHGGYNPKNGYFDPGSHGFDADGNVVEEWFINKLIATQIKDELLNRGATVIYTSGSVYSVVDPIKKHDQEVDATISVHLNSCENPSVNGYQVYTGSSQDEKDIELANELKNQINKSQSVSLKQDNFAVLRASESNPSVLLEAGFMSNANDIKNILDQQYRAERCNEIVNAIANVIQN